MSWKIWKPRGNTFQAKRHSPGYAPSWARVCLQSKHAARLGYDATTSAPKSPQLEPWRENATVQAERGRNEKRVANSSGSRWNCTCSSCHAAEMGTRG